MNKTMIFGLKMYFYLRIKIIIFLWMFDLIIFKIK